MLLYSAACRPVKAKVKRLPPIQLEGEKWTTEHAFGISIR